MSCFKNMASTIISVKWYTDRNNNDQDESLRIVIAAAKSGKAQIRESAYTTDQYPLSHDIRDRDSNRQWIPSLLVAFMENIIGNDLKLVSLSHCIVQAARPRTVISPIQFGVGVSLDHVFGSKVLLNFLARLGLCITSDESNRFKQCVVQCSTDDNIPTDGSCFNQWSADNVDHNINIVDGQGSFHGMGVISVDILRAWTKSEWCIS